MPVVIIIIAILLFVYWPYVVQLLNVVGIVVISLVGIIVVVQIGIIIARMRAKFRQRLEREQYEWEMEEQKRRIAESDARWSSMNTLTRFLHVRLDSDGNPKSATVQSGEFAGRDVVGMNISELHEFRIETFGAGDGVSWDYVDVLKQQSEGSGWSSRIRHTYHLFVLWNVDQTRALRAHVRFHPELNDLAGKEIADLSSEEIRNLLGYFEALDQESAQVVKDILGRSRAKDEDPDHKATDPGRRSEDGEQRFTGMSPSTMTRRDAPEILELAVDCPGAEVHARARTLVQVVHPDRGGTDRLAQLVIRARERLIEPPGRDESNRNYSIVQSRGEMSLPDALEILGLQDNSPVSEVKRRAREVVGLVHPGTGGSRRLEDLVLQAQEVVLNEEAC